MFSPASYIWLFKIVYSFHSWKHFKQYSIIFFPYFHIHVNIQRGKICIWIDCKKVSLTLSSITLPPCRNGIFQTELHSMCASVWNLWGDFRKITHLFWGMILENEYVVLLRKKKKVTNVEDLYYLYDVKQKLTFIRKVSFWSFK